MDKPIFEATPKNDGLSALDEATREIIQTLQLDTVLEIVLSKAYQITGADLVKIYLTDQTGSLSKSNSLTKSSSLEVEAGGDELLFALAEQAALSQQIIAGLKEAIPEKQGTFIPLLIPILSREKLIGVLALASAQPTAFSAHQIRWLSVFCGQAAIAIENARLFQDLSAAYIDLAQSREKILHSRNTLQVVFDAITDGLYILNQDLTIHILNRVEAERQGYKPEELIGKSYLALAWTKSAPELLDQIKAALRTGRETTWISAENENDPYLKDREFRIYPIRDRVAQTKQVVVFAQDVAERRRWQASLFRSANLAAVGQLAGSVAHQINNPLTVTMTNSQLLMLDTDPDSELYELAAGILKAGERIQNIVTNLLEFSNQEQYFFVQTDLIETIEGALELVIRSLNKAHIKVVKNYQARPVLPVSVSHLKLVWVNLLLNARDAVVDYAAHPQITISTQSVSEREVKVAITDNGIGLTEKAMDQLFRPFFTTKPVGKALGLGLYSAHMIVERHRGTIKAFSRPGVATTFEVILPIDNPRDL
jgi:two-component system NtrC family sensor kinase